MADHETAKAAKNEREDAPIHRKLAVNQEYLKKRLDIGVSFDIGVRELSVGEKKLAFYFINGFPDNMVVVEMLRELSRVKREELVPQVLTRMFRKYLTHPQVEELRRMDEVVDKLLAGHLVVLIDGEQTALAVDARHYPARQPEEPDTERVVRGSRDGFTETLVFNTALIRRRVRDERLRMELVQVGERSKTDVCLAYLKDVADPELVRLIRDKLSRITVDGLPMAEKALEEFLVGRNWHPFPLVRYTERPDVAASHLLEGHVLVLVDTSPSVIIAPTTFFHHVQHAEEYRQTPVVGTYLRWIRFIGILLSIFLLPLWLLFVFNPELLPKELAFIGPKKSGEIPIFFQFILAEIGIDLMRMAAVHTPTPLATAMGLIAAVLIGEVAIKVGLFAPETILYTAVAAIGMFATPSYELSLAVKLVRLFLLLMVFLFKVPGFVLGVTVIVFVLAMTRSLNTPYLWPLIPFNWPALRTILFRTSVPSMKMRPSIVRPQDASRQSS
ncbi:spore germination protein [Calditerricola satsumensis]|uniref:Stage V sporulation protein AF n=1 Tax=Calditerricola satsumensis TaxID=373054 RepID=A0A8J3B6Z4_9BACI|nr:spore germination protein [Calditerricola satsumensis]GGK00297.1 stage V sporulation protein AF [Calditerricola satsumensis]